MNGYKIGDLVIVTREISPNCPYKVGQTYTVSGFYLNGGIDSETYKEWYIPFGYCSLATKLHKALL